jgi:hypothetical protein
MRTFVLRPCRCWGKISMVDSARIRAASIRLLEPYTIPVDTLYLSEDQRELSELSFEKRGEWMAEWLLLASQTEDTEE